MAKKLDEWLNEFVAKGFNPQDLLNWPDEGGGGSGNITLKAGQKIRIDLSQYKNFFDSYDDDWSFHNSPMSLFVRANLIIPTSPVIDQELVEIDYEAFDSPHYMISMVINQERTQILCECGYVGPENEYTSLMPITVVYSSETPIAYNVETREIDPEVLAALPVVEIDITEELVGKVLMLPKWEPIPFEIV